MKEEEEDSAATPMSVNGAAVAPLDGRHDDDDGRKRQRTDRCFSFMEIPIEPKIKSLKHLDSKKFKSEIKRWAKAVVTYARQVSDRFGSTRRSQDSSGERFGSSRMAKDSGNISRKTRDSSDTSGSLIGQLDSGELR